MWVVGSTTTHSYVTQRFCFYMISLIGCVRAFKSNTICGPLCSAVMETRISLEWQQSARGCVSHCLLTTLSFKGDFFVGAVILIKSQPTLIMHPEDVRCCVTPRSRSPPPQAAVCKTFRGERWGETLVCRIEAVSLNLLSNSETLWLCERRRGFRGESDSTLRGH